MKTLTDPGKGKTEAQAKAARLAAWAKPKTKAERDKLRAQRVADYEEVHGPIRRGK